MKIQIWETCLKASLATMQNGHAKLSGASGLGSHQSAHWPELMWMQSLKSPLACHATVKFKGRFHVIHKLVIYKTRQNNQKKPLDPHLAYFGVMPHETVLIGQLYQVALSASSASSGFSIFVACFCLFVSLSAGHSTKFRKSQ